MVNVFANGFEVDSQCVVDIVDGQMHDHGLTSNYEVNVNFVSQAEMIKLHDKKHHDVLSFPLEKEVGPDGVTRMGDIVVLGTLPAHKRDELIAHSCLHLLGIHHD